MRSEQYKEGVCDCIEILRGMDFADGWVNKLQGLLVPKPLFKVGQIVFIREAAGYDYLVLPRKVEEVRALDNDIEYKLVALGRMWPEALLRALTPAEAGV